MATTAGALTVLSVQDRTASLSSAPATGGTAPYTYQWYRSTTSGFTPGGGNILAGQTSLQLNDTGLIPNTVYYWKVVATDSGSVAGTSAQVSATTVASILPISAFGMGPVLGQLDLLNSPNTISAEIDVSQSGTIYCGQAVKVVNSPGGVPKVVACAANSDQVFGFLCWDTKRSYFQAYDKCEIAQALDVMYLFASGAIARGQQVTLDVSSPGAVGQKVTSSGASIVGWAVDQAPAAGALVRIHLQVPAFTVA